MKALAYIIPGLLALWLLYGPLPTLYLKYLRHWRLPAPAGAALLLTFDDGPDPLYTPEFLQALGRYQAHALFFVVGAQAEKHPELVASIQSQGHALAWHGPLHRNMWFMGYAATRTALREGAEFLNERQGSRYYRPPYGNVNLFTLALARAYGLKLLLWTVIVRDWRVTPPQLLLERLRQGCRAGGVILLHDGSQGRFAQSGAAAHTLEALDLFIPAMQARGYRFCDPRHLPRGEECL